jgi:hypothetical protein
MNSTLLQRHHWSKYSISSRNDVTEVTQSTEFQYSRTKKWTFFILQKIVASQTPLITRLNVWQKSYLHYLGPCTIIQFQQQEQLMKHETALGQKMDFQCSYSVATARTTLAALPDIKSKTYYLVTLRI